MISRYSLIAGVFIFLLSISATRQKQEVSAGVRKNMELFRSRSQKFAATVSELKTAIRSLDESNPQTLKQAKTALADARSAYKAVEGFMEYFFFNSARIYNRAAKNEIEEPYLEYQKPMGLQYIEAILFEKDVFSRKDELLAQLNVLEPSADDLNSLLYEFKATDAQMLECHRLTLIRLMSLGITGFDAPLLKTGITESFVVMDQFQQGIVPYLKTGEPWDDSLSHHLNKSLTYLKAHPDFDTFDRLTFLTEYCLPLQTVLGKIIREKGLETNTHDFLNYNADHLFSADAFDSDYFSPKTSLTQVALGKKLFNEPLLSGNGRLSCSTCHVPANSFQDGIDKSFGFDGKTKIARNAPTLLYASYQHAQFWDGRKRTLEEQIDAAMADSAEMNADADKVVAALLNKKSYRRMFGKTFPGQKQSLTKENIHRAIATFVRTLHPFNSNFDRYIAGDKNALSASQIKGFNLFMGKAQCGTCHFAPLFNGLIPPIYKFTEFEVLGTPLNENLSKPEMDPDQGRFSFRSIEFYKGAFKTPTVRNTAATAPYMHHGGFASLDSLIEFYNKGGGAGLGMDVPHQTLAAIPLNLSEGEKKDIVSFLNALTDAPEFTSRRIKRSAQKP